MNKDLSEKDVKQVNIIHSIMSSFINDDSDSFKQLINDLAKLRNEDVLHVAFSIAQSLNQENLKLINNRRSKYATSQSD